MRVVAQRAKERQRRADAADLILADRASQPRDRLGARRRPDDELREQRVVVDRDLPSLVDAAVDANAGARGLGERRDAARRGDEAVVGILGVDAAFDRDAAQRDVLLREPERLARGDTQLRRDQIDARDHLRHRVLDLQPRVHLEEVEVAIRVDEKLQRSGPFVRRGASDRHRGLAHATAQVRVVERRGALLDHLLMSPLERALALAEVDARAVAIGEHLDLDVARPLDRLLDVDR